MAESPPEAPASSSSNNLTAEGVKNKPVCLMVIGMAGSGKSTFTKCFTSYLFKNNKPPYAINLDPACKNLGFSANIDIRDTVNYKEIMKQYQLGPNGGIVTALNIFATKFDQVLKFIEKRSGENEFVIVDTPGQIEVFTWSASGNIITEALASSVPTVVLYVVDTPRSARPVTFMSNMMYACSILYKTRLPFIVVMNKVDVVSCDFAIEWMRDWESFHAALSREENYISSLSSSMSLALDEFYNTLDVVGVSAITGEGMENLVKAIHKAKMDYCNEYLPEYERLKKEKQMKVKQDQDEEMKEVIADMYVAPTEAYIKAPGMHNYTEETKEEQANLEEAEERKEKPSFNQFLENQKARQTFKEEAQKQHSS